MSSFSFPISVSKVAFIASTSCCDADMAAAEDVWVLEVYHATLGLCFLYLRTRETDRSGDRAEKGTLRRKYDGVQSSCDENAYVER